MTSTIPSPFPTLDSLRRVIVAGTSGSGKTTFAAALSRQLDCPHIEVDRLFWRPGWTATPDEELFPLISAQVAGERWVFDGNYGRLNPVVYPRATALLWLNYPFPLIFWRVFRRTVSRCIRRAEVFPGCCESLRLSFLDRDSLLWWVLTTHRRRTRKYRGIFDENRFPHMAKIELRNPQQARAFLESLGHPPSR